ncbi:hydrogenase nickel incorporation protein HypB [Bacteroidota bacterium]
MCETCGCGNPEAGYKILKPGENNRWSEVNTVHHDHPHDEHHHHHSHSHSHEEHSHTTHHKEISVETSVLYNNNLLAERNRGFLLAKNIKAYNLVSSPGSGKTTLLEKTIQMVKKKEEVFVIEGDQQTSQDAMRIHATGARVVQVNTGTACHLDADMVHNALRELEILNDSFLFIENVGNLVCPALFDLGENKRILIVSVTEGEDKPLKYPYMFESSHLCIVNKIDLLPYVDFDLNKFREYAERINHHLEFIELSSKTEENLEEWVKWLGKVR